MKTILIFFFFFFFYRFRPSIDKSARAQREGERERWRQVVKRRNKLLLGVVFLHIFFSLRRFFSISLVRAYILYFLPVFSRVFLFFLQPISFLLGKSKWRSIYEFLLVVQWIPIKENFIVKIILMTWDYPNDSNDNISADDLQVSSIRRRKPRNNILFFLPLLKIPWKKFFFLCPILSLFFSFFLVCLSFIHTRALSLHLFFNGWTTITHIFTARAWSNGVSVSVKAWANEKEISSKAWVNW